MFVTAGTLLAVTLTPDAVLAAAQVLHDTRDKREQIARLPNHLTPRTVDEGYAIQRAGHELAGRGLGPWKVGATTVSAQRLLGIDGPFVGRPDADRVVPSGTEMVLEDWFAGPPAIETEIGLMVQADLVEIPDDPMDLAELVDVVPSLELVNPRFADMTVVGAPSLIADNAAASAIVAGVPLGWTADQIRQLDRLTVSVDIDGARAADGTGAMALGHPLKVLQYAARLAAAWGSPIAAGQLVITGTCTGVIAGAPGMHVVGRFEGASVEVSFR